MKIFNKKNLTKIGVATLVLTTAVVGVILVNKPKVEEVIENDQNDDNVINMNSTEDEA